MEALALSFASGWASGINSYLVVLVLGIAERVGGFEQVPDVLGAWWVIGIAGVMFAVEFVADKVPYVDSLWDGVSTFIRPAVGALLGALVVGQDPDLNEIVGALVGGSSALASHSVKAGTRLAVNASPEPASNIAVSTVEDVAVLGVSWLAIEQPEIAALIAGVLLAIGLVALFFVIALIRRGLRRVAAWRAGSSGPAEPA